MLEGPFVLGRCGIGLFADLLAADRKSAIDLIRGLVASDQGPTKSNDGFVLTLAGQERRISPAFSYGWSRGNAPSTIVAMALKALEFSAHNRIDAGERLDDVVREVLGDGPGRWRPLLVMVDSRPLPFVVGRSTARRAGCLNGALTLDATRAQHDVANKMAGGSSDYIRKVATLRCGESCPRAWCRRAGHGPSLGARA